ncbi:MAG: hypothetical protein IKB42_04375 [Clostridia bacterium]|nr:hypothetical protein [Clostridia bacterium]
MKGKYIVPLILASVSATTFGAHAQFSVKADYDAETTLSGDLISISGFEGEGTIGTAITLPEAKDAAGNALAGAKIKVLDPRGKEVTVNASRQFTPTLKGYYTVKYSVETAGQITTATEDLRILVQGDEYAISLPTNSKYVIPATVKTNTELSIPLPTVTENGEELSATEVASHIKVSVANLDNASTKKEFDVTKTDDYDATNKVFKYKPTQAGVYEIVYRYVDANGTVQDYKTDKFTVKNNFSTDDMALSFSYKSTKPTTAVMGNETTLPQIKVFDKNNASVELEAYVTITVKNVASGKTYEVKDYKFTPMEKGAYEVTYKAEIPVYGKSTGTNTFRIENVKDNVSPEVFVSNAYTKTTANGVTTIDKVYRDNDKNGEFGTGDVVLFDASLDENKNLSATELKEKINKAMGDASYNIPSVVYLQSDGTGTAKATVKLPAIYAADNFSDFSKLTFTRSVRSKTGLITEIKKTEANGTKTAYAPNEWAEHTFTAEGEYTIRYEVKDENGNTYMDSTPIKVLSSDATLKKDGVYKLPTLTFPATSSYAKASDTLKINQPSATDEHDTRVETRVYYSLAKDFTAADKVNEITETNKSGQLLLDLSKISGITTADKVYIHAVAYNDYAQDYAIITREVQIIDTNDGTPATFVNADTFMTALATKNDKDPIDAKGMIAGKPAFDQKEVVKLPDYLITDVEDTNLNITLTVKDPYGKVVTVKNSSYEKTVERDAQDNITLNKYSVKNGTFVADYSGVYTITYTAKDAGGNIVSKSYGVRVRDTEKPLIQLSSYAPFTEAVEVGKFVEVPAATLTDKGVTLTDITTNIPFESRVAGKAGTYWELVEGPSLNTMGTVGFTPNVAGDYVIKYYGWDTEGNLTESKKYTITASDSIKPTIVLEKDYILKKVEWNEDDVVTVYAPGVVELYDGHRDADDPTNDFDQTPVSDITLTVKVYDKNNNLVESEAVEEDAQGNKFEISAGVYATRYKFVAEAQGVYTIKYIATDAFGNSSEEEVSVAVGDTDAPVVEWVDSEEDFKATAKIGDTYEFNLDMVTLDDIVGTDSIVKPSGQDAADYKITVNMYDSSSSLVTNLYKNDDTKENAYKWEFEKSGTYELRIVAEDKAGNKTTKSMNIVVAEDEVEEEKVNPVVGTVLIVVSSLILVGVVVYFVVTGRSTSTKKGPKAKKQ